MKQTICKYCKGINHTSIMCFNKPRLPIKKESEKTKSRRTATNRLWFELNPPNNKGLWYCYLQISKDCPIKLTRSTIQLEHVKSRTRYPQLRFDVNNLKPSCKKCNELKGSLDLEELALTTINKRATLQLLLNKGTIQ